MRYFLAIFFPPVAVLTCGKAGSFVLNVILTICGVLPGMVHAIAVVSAYHADRRTDRIVNAASKAFPSSSITIQQQTANSEQTPKRLFERVGFAAVVILAVALSAVKKSESTGQATPIYPAAYVPGLVADNKLPAYSVISDESNQKMNWRRVKISLQEKASEEELRAISNSVKAAKPNDPTNIVIFYLLPEQVVGAGAWAKAEFDPSLKIEIFGISKEVFPPKSDDEIIGQWEWELGRFFTLSRAKDGLKMTCTRSKDAATMSAESVSTSVEGNRVIIRPTKAYKLGDPNWMYWIVDGAKNLLLVNEAGTFGKAAALVKPTLAMQNTSTAVTEPTPKTVSSSPAPTFSTVDEAKSEAIRRYPDLAVADSVFNREFVARYKVFAQPTTSPESTSAVTL